MGRELKRVPLDFDYPLHKVWYGYYMNYIPTCKSTEEEHCEQCREFARIKGIATSDFNCPMLDDYFGEVVSKLKELCAWCETNATTFGDFKATKEEWMQMLSNDFVHHREGNIIMF